ncbi:MAG: alkaline ceramidase, partial [Saprospiraceae bacterium]
MKPILLYIFFAIFIFLQCKSVPSSESNKMLQAGAASAVINPPVGAFIAGDKQNRRFTSILDSLFAKAVVLYDGKTALALVTIDCIGLLYPEINQIRERASRLVSNISLPANHI